MFFMTKPGLYMVNIKQWGVHEPDTLLAPLSMLRRSVDDSLIEKAKRWAEALGIASFAVVAISNAGKRTPLYQHTR